MRVAWLLASIVVGCAGTTSSQTSAPPAQRAAKLRGDVAVFVRDASGRATQLAADICRRLASAGLSCRAVDVPQTPAAVATDVDTARRLGASFALRVTVVQRRSTPDPQPPSDAVLVPATGAVGRRTAVGSDVAPPNQDLRLEAAASLRRVSAGDPMARWVEDEAILAFDVDSATHGAGWDAVYDFVARRVASRVVTTLGQAQSARQNR